MPARASKVPPRAEPLLPGEFAVLAYRLGRARATGVLAVYRAASDSAVARVAPATAASGVGGRPAVLVVRRGQVITPKPPHRATNTEADSPARPSVVVKSGFSRVLIDRQMARKLAEIAGWPGARYTFDGGLLAYPPGAVDRQFPLVAWARAHIESQLDAGRAHAMAGELAGARMWVARHVAPDPALCDDTDLRILDAMRAPRRLDQIATLAKTPRYRLLTFVHFLRVVGGLHIDGVVISHARRAYPRHDRTLREEGARSRDGRASGGSIDRTAGPSDSIDPTPVIPPNPDRTAGPSRSIERTDRARSAHALLGVSTNADLITVKRAYRRMARALHPDLHPDAGEARRRSLERKLAEVTCAYVELTGSR